MSRIPPGISSKNVFHPAPMPATVAPRPAKVTGATTYIPTGTSSVTSPPIGIEPDKGSTGKTITPPAGIDPDQSSGATGPVPISDPQDFA
jgi:hypothetical protein